MLTSIAGVDELAFRWFPLLAKHLCSLLPPRRAGPRSFHRTVPADGPRAQRSWLITGVNSGFGRQMTEQLLARGDRLAGTVGKPDAVEDLKDKYGYLV